MVSVASGWVREQAAPTAFERLFQSEYGKVVAVAYRVLGDGAEAEDVAQEVFCSFYQRHDPNAHYAPSWLYRAAVHTALNLIRGKKRRARRETAHAAEGERLQLGATQTVDPLEVVQRQEESRRLREALGRLPAKHAAVLALRYSGLSYAEVADTLGLKANQVGTLLRRGEAALKKELTNATS